jgi:hypothetical protein
MITSDGQLESTATEAFWRAARDGNGSDETTK